MATRKKKFNVADVAMKIAGVGAGAVAAKAINKPLGNLNPNIKGLLKLVAGAALPMVSKSEFVGNVGNGMIAVGASEIIGGAVPALSGVLDQGIGDYGSYDEFVSGDDYDTEYYDNDDDDDISGLDTGIGGDDDLTDID